MNKQTLLKLLFLVILICFITIFIINTHNLFENFEGDDYNKENNIELLVSRYNEDLEWLNDDLFNKYYTTIYNKGPNENYYKPKLLKEEIKLDNVGVCVHSYLYYIITNYEKLPNIVVFLPGSCMDNHKKDLTMKTMKKVEEINDTVFYTYENKLGVKEELYDFTIDNHNLANSNNRDINNDSSLRKCDIRPFGRWYNSLFPNINIYNINYNGIFAVSKEHILNRSKESYIELIKFVSNDINEECAHYFERSFLALFYPIPKKNIILF
jgi:hypothetical protein